MKIKTTSFFRTKLIVTIALFAVVLCAACIFPVVPALEESSDWFGRAGLLGVALMAILLAVGSLCLLPASPFVVALAAVFGFPVGCLGSTMGLALGAAGGFLLARKFLRRDIAVRLRGHPTFKAIDLAVAEEGWKIVALLRLCPIPFGLANYLYGLTGIRFWPYLLTTLVGSLPSTALFCQLGSAGKVGLRALMRGELHQNQGQMVLLAVGCLIALGLLIALPYLAKRAIAKYSKVTIPS